MFPILVPDFINWDPQASARTLPPDARDRRGRTKRVPFVPKNLRTALAMMEVVTQRRNPVTIPADVIGAVLWGANRAAWPKNWLRVILNRPAPQDPAELPRAERARRTRESRAAANATRRVCPPDCPMHGGPNHLHVTTTFYDAGLGRMKLLQCGKNPDGSARFDLTNKYTKEEAEKLQNKLAADIADRQSFLRILREEDGSRVGQAERELLALKRRYKGLREGSRKVAGLRPIYLPAWVFATSPRMGLTPTQQNLLVALTLERTRDVKPSRGAAPTKATNTCPFLDALTAHVGFNGNGAGGRAWLRGTGTSPPRG